MSIQHRATLITAMALLLGACASSTGSTFTPEPTTETGSPHADVADGLNDAIARWEVAGIGDYELVVRERSNVWTAGCEWHSTVAGGVVSQQRVVSPNGPDRCGEGPATVEDLHEMVRDWLQSTSVQPDAEVSVHDEIKATFNDVGVLSAGEVDIAIKADEESTFEVQFTPTGG